MIEKDTMFRSIKWKKNVYKCVNAQKLNHSRRRANSSWSTSRYSAGSRSSTIPRRFCSLNVIVNLKWFLRMWEITPLRCSEAYSQPSQVHLYGFTARWIRSCFAKWESQWKDLLHPSNLQANFLGLCATTQWFITRLRVLAVKWHCCWPHSNWPNWCSPQKCWCKPIYVLRTKEHSLHLNWVKFGCSFLRWLLASVL